MVVNGSDNGDDDGHSGDSDSDTGSFLGVKHLRIFINRNTEAKTTVTFILRLVVVVVVVSPSLR